MRVRSRKRTNRGEGGEDGSSPQMLALWKCSLSRIHAVERYLSLTLSLLERARGAFGRTESASPKSNPGWLRPGSPLPARSGERTKVRGNSDCMLKAQRGDEADPAPILNGLRVGMAGRQHTGWLDCGL